ncbi:carbon storage regulator CsrA [Desulfitobacterium sp. AusDCA]|uniref:carbon storage regulator CsrA n=1 Tax=Desulfitobacterium sp. AusDCA TaxID=3240383 RepID=UPI003DA6EB23
MLALTRKIGEKIMIGDDIVLTVFDIKGDSVRLSIEAPKDIKIYRGEIYDSIVEENKQSVKSIDLAQMDLLKNLKDLKK